MPDGKSKAEAEALLRQKRSGSWYADGVNFRCKAPECSACCSGQRGEGYVWLNADEMETIAGFIGIDFDKFTRKYIRQVDYAFSLVEQPNHDCVFLKDGGCSIYEVRPTQCRTYPYWPSIVKSRQSWAKEAEQCPGIGDETFVPGEEVANQLELELEGRRRNGVE